MSGAGASRGALALGCALLAGCAVGPDFRRPALPAQAGVLPEKALPAHAGGGDAEPQRFVSGQDIPADWWTLFHSSPLDELVRQALQNNPTLAAAQAALRQANETLSAQRGSYFPAVQAAYSFNRQRNAVGTLSPTLASGESIFDLHNAQVSVTYLLDVFGGNRRQVESQLALADLGRYQLEGAYLALTANLATAAIQEASLRAQLAATDDIIASERQAAQILRRQVELGSIAKIDLMAQEAALAASEASVPALKKQLEQQRHLLAALAGRFPSEDLAARFELASLTLPEELPISVPSALVRQRPDVLAAEAQLHAASAQVGVAIANLLPQVTLSGSAGGTATAYRELFSSGNTFWSAGASLTQTLFEGGTLWHRKRAADAALDQAGAEYRAAVLTAFQNVADALTALTLDADAVAAGVRAERAAAESLTATRRNVELGSVSFLALLSAQQAYSQALLNLTQARANRFADTAALFQALGGGWWNRDRH